MNRKQVHVALSAGLLVTIAGVAAAGVAPTVDGILDASYGAPVAVQSSSVIDFNPEGPIEVCVQSDQSNQGGKGEYFSGGSESGPVESDPALVTSGMELSIRLSDLPGSGLGGQIKIAGFGGIGGGNISNQVIGGLPTDMDALGEPRTTDFSDEILFPGDQFVTISTAPLATAAIVDGRRDSSVDETTAYGANLQAFAWASTLNSNVKNPASRAFSDGTEIDGVYGYVYDNGTPLDATDDILNLMIAGNISTNFDWFHMFFDVRSGGQNPIQRLNDGISFGALIRMGENLDGTNSQAPAELGPGLTFDTLFIPDYWMKLSIGNGNEALSIGPDSFLDSATIVGGSAGVGAFDGPNVISLAGPSPHSALIAGGVSADAVVYDVDNTNSPSTAAPNAGGVGVRVLLPGGGSQADDSAPSIVQTGTEFKITLEGMGIDPISPPASIRMAGIIDGSSWDFMSNQAIGGLTSVSIPDPPSLGFPAKNTDFNNWDGDQFVTIAIPGVIPAAPAGGTIDGNVLSSGAEGSAYGAPLWVNTTNAPGFGNSIFDPLDPALTGFPGTDRSIGSEMDAVYAYVANDPNNANKPTVFVMVTGNLHDFNKLVLFFDSIAGGQNDLRGDNSADGTNFNNGLGGPGGFTFDTGFEADLAVSYELGWNEGTSTAEHFASAIQLKTDGGGFGGSIGGGPKSGVSTPICGAVIPRIGFGNNDKPILDPGFFDRTVLANGSELDAIYMTVQGGLLHMFFAGNLEDNFTKLNIFIDTIAGGQNTLIFDSLDPNDPAYEGNPPVDFSILNRMGGPILDANQVVLNNGLTFDAGFDADFFINLGYGNFQVFDPNGNPCDGAATIFANIAKLRLPGDLPGPTALDRYRFLGQVNNDSFFGPTVFDFGDLVELVNAAAIHNGNQGGVGGGENFFCTDGSQTNPASVTTGIEIAINIADLEWDGVSTIRVMAFLTDAGAGNMANQILPHGCVNDLGEPRDVDFNSIPGNQFVSFPVATALPAPCPTILSGDANGDFLVNFSDITSVLSNWLNNYLPGTGPGDADGNGVVTFSDITAVLSNWLAGGTCN